IIRESGSVPAGVQVAQARRSGKSLRQVAQASSSGKSLKHSRRRTFGRVESTAGPVIEAFAETGSNQE
ncbi:MAG: hypothetical protein ACK6DB_13660, partial [Planctomycetota bacterium]